MMDDFLEQAKRAVPQIEIKSDEPLRKFTAFKSGGNTRYFVAVNSIDQMVSIVTCAWNNALPVRVIGSGTTILARELGFSGVLIKNNCRRFELRGMRGKFADNQVNLPQAYLFAEAGAITNQVVRFVVDQGFGGIEYTLGLPGTIGGAVSVNANFPKENIRIGRAVYGAKVLTKEGIKDVDNSYFHFGFDTSQILREKSVLLSLLFALYPEEKKKLSERAEQVVTYRTNTQPKNFTTGMTFRNMSFTNLSPNSSLPDDVSLEFLLEKVGLLGYHVGDVEIWKENPHYLLNHGGGTMDQVETLLQHLKETVFGKFGVQLEVQLHSLE